MTGRKPESGEPESVWFVVGQHAGWGLTIAASIGFFLWVGLMVDRRLGTLPLLTVLGALVGGAAGFYSMFRQLVIEPRESEDGERGAEGGAREDR